MSARGQVTDKDTVTAEKVLSKATLRAADPQRLETWLLFIRSTGVQVAREFPRAEREFTQADFGADPRLTPFWNRS